MFLKEEVFLRFLRENLNQEFSRGNSLVSINLVNLKPVRSCIYLSNNMLCVAKFNEAYGIFNELLVLKKNQIQSIEFENDLSGQRIVAIKKGEENQKLTMSVTKLSFLRWHNQNLKTLSQKFGVKS